MSIRMLNPKFLWILTNAWWALKKRKDSLIRSIRFMSNNEYSFWASPLSLHLIIVDGTVPIGTGCWGKNQNLELSRNQVWNQVGPFFKLASTFHPLDTLFNTSSIPRAKQRVYSLLFQFLLPPPSAAENQFHDGIDCSQGINFLESMPWVLESLMFVSAFAVSRIIIPSGCGTVATKSLIPEN